MGKPTICIGENKGADQLRSNCEADQRFSFRYTYSTIPLLSKSKISSFQPSSVTVQPGLCRTWSEPKLLVFSRTGSFISNTTRRKTEITSFSFLNFFFSICFYRLIFRNLVFQEVIKFQRLNVWINFQISRFSVRTK